MKLPKNEYELQSDFHKWYATSHPSTISSATPYVNMKHGTATKTKRKGYLKGFPDYLIEDPRFKIRKNKKYIKLCFCSGIRIEFKTPKGNGIISKYQKNVLKVLNNRGYISVVINDLDTAKSLVQNYEKDWIPYYNSDLKINIEKKKFIIPLNLNKCKIASRIEKKKKNPNKTIYYNSKFDK